MDDDLMSAKEYLHVAKLALYGARLSSRLDTERGQGNVELARLLDEEERANALRGPVPLVNQATFLSMGYVTLVWLREHIRLTDLDTQKFHAAVKRRFDPVADTVHRSSVKADGSPGRNLSKISQVLRTVRNALAHSQVTFDDDVFCFRNEEKLADGSVEQAEVRLDWGQFRRLAEAVLFAYQEQVYGGAPGRGGPNAP